MIRSWVCGIMPLSTFTRDSQLAWFLVFALLFMACKKTSKFKNITILSWSSPKTLHSTTVTNITGWGQGRVTVSHSVKQTEQALDGIDDTLQDVGVMLLDENDDSTSVPPPPHLKVKHPPISLYSFSLSLIFSYPLELPCSRLVALL